MWCFSSHSLVRNASLDEKYFFNFLPMKHLVFILTVVAVWSCQRPMEKWPYDGDQQDVTMYVSTSKLMGFNTLPSVYHLFIYDSQKTLRYDVRPQTSGILQIKLFPGSYSGYCVTNAENDKLWEYEETYKPNQIFLKARTSTTAKTPAQDHLLSQCDFTVRHNETNTANLVLNRKVGKLRVTITNIPEWLTDLELNLTDIPQKMNLLGEYSTTTYTVQSSIAPTIDGESTTEFLVFPPRDTCFLSLTSNSLAYASPPFPIGIIKANQITEVKALFQTPVRPDKLQFTITDIDWSKDTIRTPDWPVDIPDTCDGTGNGINLVINSGFEAEFIDNLPPGWKFENGGEDKLATLVTDTIRSGDRAVRLNGKTYLYQDIPINGGECYQLKMFIRTSATNVKWRPWISWYRGSTELKINAYHPSSQQSGQLNQYTDILNGKILKAPAEANKIRIEIRTYTTTPTSGGLFLDDVSAEAVD